jgi:hypothetical protein
MSHYLGLSYPQVELRSGDTGLDSGTGKPGWVQATGRQVEFRTIDSGLGLGKNFEMLRSKDLLKSLGPVAPTDPNR